MYEKKKPYYLAFYDQFGGWTAVLAEFSSKASAFNERDRRNKNLDIKNKKAGDHFGIFRFSIPCEIACPVHNRNWLK